MGFSGDVSVMGLDEVLGFLATNGLEGVLTVSGGARSLTLYLRDGGIVCPITPPDRKSGRIDKNALAALLSRGAQIARAADPESQASSPRSRGASAPQKGKLQPDVIAAILGQTPRLEGDALAGRIEEEIQQVLRWRAARFQFEAIPLPGHVQRDLKHGRCLRFDTNSILMEAARLRDDTQRLRAVAAEDEEQDQGPPPADGAEGDLHGDLAGIGLAAVLQSLNAQRRTGTLTIFTQERRESLCFERGEAFVLVVQDAGGADPFAREMLGETWLDRTGLASDFALRHAGLTVESDLTEAEQRALKDKFLEMLFWDDAEFEFHRDRLPPEFAEPGDRVSKVALETQRFLLEAIQRLIEWDQIRRAIGGRDSILDFLDFERKMDQSFNVRGRSLQVLTLIDGRLSFEEIVKLSGLEHLEVGRIVRDLVENGHLKVVGED